MSNNIVKFPGILEPGLLNYRYVAESQYIKNSLIVVGTVEEANNLKNKSNLAVGTPFYVIERKKFYEWTGAGFSLLDFGSSEEGGSDIDFPVSDGNIYAVKNGQWIVISNLFATKEDLENINVSVDAYTKAESDEKYAQKSSLNNYYTKGEIDSKGYLTQHQDISEKVDRAELDSYYTKSETESYVASEIGKKIHMTKKVVNSSDEVVEEDVLYLIKDESASDDQYEEWYLIDGVATKVGDTSTNLNDYYTKQEIEALIPSLNGYATESWVNNQGYALNSDLEALRDSKVDASAVYSKDEIDSLLSGKASASSVYTKNEVDDLLSGIYDDVFNGVLNSSELNTKIEEKVAAQLEGDLEAIVTPIVEEKVSEQITNDLDDKIAVQVAEAVEQQAKEVYIVETEDELNGLTPEEAKLYVVKSNNSMYIAGDNGEFQCLGVYLTPSDGGSSETLTEEQLTVFTGGSAASLS